MTTERVRRAAAHAAVTASRKTARPVAAQVADIASRRPPPPTPKRRRPSSQQIAQAIVIMLLVQLGGVQRRGGRDAAGAGHSLVVYLGCTRAAHLWRLGRSGGEQCERRLKIVVDELLDGPLVWS